MLILSSAKSFCTCDWQLLSVENLEMDSLKNTSASFMYAEKILWRAW